MGCGAPPRDDLWEPWALDAKLYLELLKLEDEVSLLASFAQHTQSRAEAAAAAAAASAGS